MTNTTNTIATVGTRYAFRIQWWQFLSLADRAYKYNWSLERAEGEQVYYYNPETMWVYGRVIGETEKAYKVALDYSKHIRNSGNFKVEEGFTAYIAKKAVKDLQEQGESLEDELAQEMYCDLSGYCAGTACPRYFECHA